MAKPTTFLKGAALSVLVIAAGAQLQPAAAETLKEALALAYESNPDLRAQRAALRATDEQVARANLSVLPSVSLNASYTKLDRNTSSPVGDSTLDTLNQFKQARIDQPLFDGFTRIFNRKQAKALVRAGRAVLRQTEQTVLLGGVTAFMDVLRDEAILSLNENNVQVLRRQKEASDARFEVGEITRTDVAQSEAGLSGAISQRIISQSNLAASRATYRQVIGRFPGTLEEPPGLPPLPPSLEDAWNIALDQNPLVHQALYNEEAADHAVSSAKGDLLPEASGFAAVDRFRGGANFGAGVAESFTQDTASVGVQINIPIWSGGVELSDVRANKQVRSQRRMEVLAAQNQVRADTETAWMRYQAAVSSITSTEDQVEANAIALEGVRQEESVGQRTVLDVLNAEQALLNSRVNLVTAERDEYVAGFTVLGALGQLNAVTLQLDVDLYDPEENYRDVRYKFWSWGTKDLE